MSYKRKKVIFEGIEFESLLAAANHFKVSHTTMCRWTKEGYESFDDVSNKSGWSKADEITNPSHLKNIDWEKQHTYDEIADHLAKLGIGGGKKMTRGGISQIEDRAFRKLKAELIKLGWEY